VLVFTAGCSGEIASGLGWSRAGGTGGRVQVSRPVIERVLLDMVGILTHEALDAGPPCHAARSVLAAPLVAFDKLIGAIVLEADGPAGRFDEGHVRLMMGIAGVAQMTWHARPSLTTQSF